MVGSFGNICPRNPAIRFVEDTPKVLAPPARSPFNGVAREGRPETITLVIGDAEPVEVEVERWERPRGGAQAFWRCPKCEARREHLYVVEGLLACRVSARREVATTARRCAGFDVTASSATAPSHASRAL